MTMAMRPLIPQFYLLLICGLIYDPSDVVLDLSENFQVLTERGLRNVLAIKLFSHLYHHFEAKDKIVCADDFS